MEDMQILHEILAAEQAAREAVEKVRQEGESLPRRLESIRRDMEQEATASARQDIEEARRAALASAECVLEELDRQYDRELGALEERFAAGQEAWAEQIFRIVVGLADE